jgi:hypothetical protein
MLCAVAFFWVLHRDRVWQAAKEWAVKTDGRWFGTLFLIGLAGFIVTLAPAIWRPGEALGAILFAFALWCLNAAFLVVDPRLTFSQYTAVVFFDGLKAVVPLWIRYLLVAAPASGDPTLSFPVLAKLTADSLQRDPRKDASLVGHFDQTLSWFRVLGRGKFRIASGPASAAVPAILLTARASEELETHAPRNGTLLKTKETKELYFFMEGTCFSVPEEQDLADMGYELAEDRFFDVEPGGGSPHAPAMDEPGSARAQYLVPDAFVQQGTREASLPPGTILVGHRTKRVFQVAGGKHVPEKSDPGGPSKPVPPTPVKVLVLPDSVLERLREAEYTTLVEFPARAHADRRREVLGLNTTGSWD